MSKRRWFALFALSLSVSVLAAIWIAVPGYMDSEYYFATGRELASEKGFTEPFLWNYLDDPEGLPHPSHSYWMPLTSILAAGPMRWMGVSFRVAQIPFALLTTMLPLLTARIAIFLGLDRRKVWLAGLLACFPGFYLPYYVTTETFSLFAFVGGVALWAMASAVERPGALRWLIVGALVGFAHLTRADGFVLLVPAIIAVWYTGRRRAVGTGLVLAGYLLVMGLWFVRNASLFGSPLPTGSGRALWLASYDELFTYPASMLTPQHWWDAGLASLIRSRLHAMGLNLQSLLASNGLIFLAPLMVLGAIRGWKRPLVRLSVLYLGILLALMSFVLPHVGERGGYFHSSAALMPVLFALAADGLDQAVAWIGQRRKWKRDQSQRFFRVGAVLLSALITIGLFWGRVIGENAARPSWGSSNAIYQDVGQRLRNMDPDGGIVAVNNPPGFNIATGLPAIAIPNGSTDTLRLVVERYDASWVVLEENHPQALDDLYAQATDLPWLELIDDDGWREQSTTLLFRVIADEVQP